MSISLNELKNNIKVSKIIKKNNNDKYISRLNKLHSDIESYISNFCDKTDYTIEYNYVYIRDKIGLSYPCKQMTITVLDQILVLNSNNIIEHVSLYIPKRTISTNIDYFGLSEDKESWYIAYNINNIVELNLDTFCKVWLHLFYKKEFKP